MKTRLPQKLIPALLGLTCACAVGLNATVHAQEITGTNQVALTDFDTSTAGWDYGYFYSWGWDANGQYTNGTWLVNRYYTDPSINPTNGPTVMSYAFTNAPFYDLITTNSGAGYGTGFGGPLNWNYDFAMLSTNLADYILSFDARVEGLADGQSTANGQFQLQWNYGSKFFQNNFNFQPGSNWTHFATTLDEIGNEGGTVSNWVYMLQNSQLSALQFNINLDHPNSQFGWDDYNFILVDNLKLEVLQYAGPPPPPPPTVPFAILDWNLDDKPGWGYYGGYNWSQNSYLPTFTYSATAAGLGVGGSIGWVLTMDNSALAAPNTPAWSGGGTGGGGPVDYSRFGSGDLKAYQISFDSRAEGLNPTRTDPTTCRLQLFLDSPNGNMRVDFDVPGGSNWVTTTYLLSEGSFGTGSKAMFATNYNTITGLRTQWQIENSSSEADWGYDADNALIVDNIKLVYNAVGCPPLTITPNGSDVILSWEPLNTLGYAKVQKAPNITGPYDDVPGATNSPVTLPAASATGFFRTKWVPPTQ